MVVEFKRIDGAGQVHAKIVGGVEPPRLSNQPLRKLGIDPPVAGFVGVGQRGAVNRPSEPHVIELGGLRRQTGLDVAQALPIGYLGESHHLVLCDARQRSHGAVAFIACDNPVERTPWQEIHELRK